MWKEIKEVVASVSPLGLLFFCLGTLLIIMGIAGSIKLPGVENLAALENYRWASIGLGVPRRMIRVRPGCELFNELKLLCDSYSHQVEGKQRYP
jgi:hypothetical protein